MNEASPEINHEQRYYTTRVDPWTPPIRDTGPDGSPVITEIEWALVFDKPHVKKAQR